MAICNNCGSEVETGAAFCSSCGMRLNSDMSAQQAHTNEMNRQTEPKQEYYHQEEFSSQSASPEFTAFSQEEIEQTRIFALFSYIGILFLVPLLGAKDSGYARFHANQGLVLFIADIVFGVCALIPILGWIIAGAGSVFSTVCTVLGIINAITGKAKPLPLIGKINILK